VWKVILDSVEGVGHKRDQLGCQDASACAEINTLMGLSSFLESDNINARTDDDKTLVLATRDNVH
jgi:hypothetical protein